ncbi:MAG TPA: NUDIX domain-containing protein, partial [Solirubrobacteraceae bacterium]|nr:NUDIX domain-containing protein [Solirubrobacteraceae bacterium]
MAKLSAGLLLYRRTHGCLEVMLVHMGGPFWQHRDAGAWSIPKGEHGEEEDPLAAARREFVEETGLAVPGGEPLDLGTLRQSAGKLVHVWALAGDLDVRTISSNTFALEWPRGSGVTREFPEVDRAAWFDLPTASVKLVKGQAQFVRTLAARLREH